MRFLLTPFPQEFFSSTDMLITDAVSNESYFPALNYFWYSKIALTKCKDVLISSRRKFWLLELLLLIGFSIITFLFLSILLLWNWICDFWLCDFWLFYLWLFYFWFVVVNLFSSLNILFNLRNELVEKAKCFCVLWHYQSIIYKISFIKRNKIIS